MKEGVKHDIAAILEGRQAPPVMPGPNPHPLWTTEWFAWKEENEGYTPYHMKCRTITFICPECGGNSRTRDAGVVAAFDISEEEAQNLQEAIEKTLARG